MRVPYDSGDQKYGRREPWTSQAESIVEKMIQKGKTYVSMHQTAEDSSIHYQKPETQYSDSPWTKNFDLIKNPEAKERIVKNLAWTLETIEEGYEKGHHTWSEDRD